MTDASEDVLLTSSEVCEQTGVSYRQLDYWVSIGLISSAGDDQPGSGKVRQWTPLEAETVARIGRLADAGLPLEFAAAMARDRTARAELAPGVTVEVAW